MRKVTIALLASVVLVVGVSGFASSTVLSAATLSVSPDVGHPRIPVTAQGSGFVAGEAVDLSFDAIPLGKARVDGEGAFKARVRIPSSALPGEHQVLAVGESSGLSASDTFLVRTDWARFLLDGANRWNRFENVLGPDNVGQLTELWSIDQGCSECTLVLSGGILYTETSVYDLSARDPSTGGLLWSVSFLPSFMRLGPVVADGMVLVGLDNGRVVSLDAATGEAVWSVVINEPNSGQALTADADRLYMPLADNTLVALDLQDGSREWTAQFSSLPSGAAVAGGVVYVGTFQGGTFALDAATGATLWESSAACYQCQALVYAAGLVFSGRIDGNFYSALDASTGETVWSVNLEHANGMETAPASANGVLFIPTTEVGWFYAVDARTGEVIWSAHESDFWASSPAVANGVVYIGNDNGSLVAVDAVTGTTLWEKDDVYTGYGPPIVADGRVFVQGGGLWAFGLPER